MLKYCFFLIIALFLTLGRSQTSCQSNSDCKASDQLCIHGICNYCSTNANCVNSVHECKFDSDVNHNVCVRKSLFSNFGVREVFGTIICFLAAMLAAGAGVGGGGIFVPVLIMISGLEAKEAVPVSQAMIFGGAIVNLLMNLQLKNPNNEQKTLIDWNTILVIEPMCLAGVSLGVIFNVMFPQWLLVVLLAIILSYLSFRTVRKTKRAWSEETERRKLAIEKTASDVSSEDTDNEDDNDLYISSNGVAISCDDEFSSSDKEPILVQLEEEENSLMVPVIGTIIVWLIGSAISTFKGGKSGANSIVGVEVCSVPWYLLTSLQFPLFIIFTMIVSARTRRFFIAKSRLGWIPTVGDVVWSARNTYIYPILTIIACMLGGMLGIGGGMIIGPLLLELGMHPKAVQATSATTVLVTASAAALQFMVIGALILDVGLWYFGVGIISTYFGQLLMNYLMAKFNRSSFIIMAIAIVIILACIMMVSAGVIQVVGDLEEGNPMGFSAIC